MGRSEKPINVLIVDDSPSVRQFLTAVLGDDPEIRVIGTAKNGEEALLAAERKKPDLITMDIHMPGMDGFEATRKILETNPIPIVVVSGLDVKEVTLAYKIIEAGALAAVPRPAGFGHPQHSQTVLELRRTIKLMSEIKVVKRWSPARLNVVPPPIRISVSGDSRNIRIVLIGASTGGPAALNQLLSGLPTNFPVPILIVQHMAAGFLGGFVEWLNQASGYPVQVAAPGVSLKPGNAYVAPEDRHIAVSSGNKVYFSSSDPENSMRPAVSYLFRSAARELGAQAVGILLTGMGTDGARELREMRETGAITIAQDAESSVVHGMPGEAIRIDGASYVLSPDKIAELLPKIVLGKD